MRLKIKVWTIYKKSYLLLVLGAMTVINPSCSKKSDTLPIRKTIDLSIGEEETVKLSGGEEVSVKLISMNDSVDGLTSAVRMAGIRVMIDGEEVQLESAGYNIPVTVGKVQVDCPVTKAYLKNARRNWWELEKDARLRLWPKNSPLTAPGTFVYPIRQRFLVNDTQTGNEPAFVNGGDVANQKQIYYHAGFDFGGSEGRDEVISAVDGIVIAAGNDIIPGYNEKLDDPGYDAVYIQDSREWLHGYFHLFSIDPAIRPGEKVKMGQKIGILGKEGASGGWSHLHYEILCKQPSGKWGYEDTYPYVWEAYKRQNRSAVVAVARPHVLAATGDKVVLDGSKSKSFSGEIVSYEWIFCNGTTAGGARQEKVYRVPGTYSEVLKVIDSQGNSDYDFTVVQIVDKEESEKLPPTIHATYYPSLGIKVGNPVIFGVRTFRKQKGSEQWDFGDDSPKVNVQSEVSKNSKEGIYAEVEHRFQKSGLYLVRVEGINEFGYKAVAHLDVEVEKE